MAGYSGTPLPKKLGIKTDHRVALLHAPANFMETLGALPDGVTLLRKLDRKPVNVVLLFVRSSADLAAQFSPTNAALDHDGGLWVAWPKKSSGVKTDLTEDTIRVLGLECGLVDNKVCAVDGTWSGLRFMYRLKDRPRRAV